jgi:hypothetical protein
MKISKNRGEEHSLEPGCAEFQIIYAAKGNFKPLTRHIHLRRVAGIIVFLLE